MQDRFFIQVQAGVLYIHPVQTLEHRQITAVRGILYVQALSYKITHLALLAVLQVL